MAHPHHDTLAVVPVMLATAVGLALLGRIPRGSVHATPLVMVQAAATPWTPRPPTPPVRTTAPHADGSATPGAEGVPGAASDGLQGLSGELMEFNGESSWSRESVEYFTDDWGGYGDQPAFERWLYYYRRASAQRWAAIQAARTRPAFNFLAPGDLAGSLDAAEPRFDPCGFFPRACSGRAGQGATGAPVTEPTGTATAVHRGHTWVLENQVTTVAVDLSHLCALEAGPLRASDGSADGTHPVITFVTPADATGCAVSPYGVPSGAGLQILWTGNGWSQRAVLTLDDTASAPDATVTLVRALGGGHQATWRANLTPTAMTWEEGTVPITVPPGTVTRTSR